MANKTAVRDALLLLKDICSKHQGEQCNFLSGDETGTCPISEVTEFCPIDFPESWQIKEEAQNEAK